MEQRKKVCVFVAAHCAPKILKLTLGTWLQAYDGSYDADVYVGVHSNYHHYHPGLAEIKELEPAVRLTLVDEMDWSRPTGKMPMAYVMRFSEMHTRSLLEMMGRARRESGMFTHAAFLDHDLVFREDFVGWAMREGCDMVGTLFENRLEDRDVRTDLGGVVPFAPKVSAWHLVVSRLMFDCMLEWPETVLPGEHGGRMFDSLSWSYEMAKRWGMRTRFLPEREAADMVVHLWSMSFNYGPKQEGSESYAKKVAGCEAEYDRRFPDGIGGLLAKLGRA